MCKELDIFIFVKKYNISIIVYVICELGSEFIFLIVVEKFVGVVVLLVLLSSGVDSVMDVVCREYFDFFVVVLIFVGDNVWGRIFVLVSGLGGMISDLRCFVLVVNSGVWVWKGDELVNV